MPPNFEPKFGFSPNNPSFFETVFSPNSPAFGSVSLTPVSIWYWSAPRVGRSTVWTGRANRPSVAGFVQNCETVSFPSVLKGSRVCVLVQLHLFSCCSRIWWTLLLYAGWPQVDKFDLGCGDPTAVLNHWSNKCIKSCKFDLLQL